jgi:hypothetical protein
VSNSSDFYLLTGSIFSVRNILPALFANGFPAPLFLSAAPARARLYRSHQRIVSATFVHSQFSFCALSNRLTPSPHHQELRLSPAIFGESACSRRGGRDTLGRGGHIHRFRRDSERLSQRGNTLNAHFDDPVDGLIPRRSRRPRPCGHQRKCLCDCRRLRISCTLRFPKFTRASWSKVTASLSPRP